MLLLALALLAGGFVFWLWRERRPQSGSAQAEASFARLEERLPGGFHALPNNGTLGELRIQLAVDYRQQKWSNFTMARARALDERVDEVLDRIDHPEKYSDQPELEECEHTQCVLAAREIFIALRSWHPKGYAALPVEGDLGKLRARLGELEQQMCTDKFRAPELNELQQGANMVIFWLAVFADRGRAGESGFASRTLRPAQSIQFA